VDLSIVNAVIAYNESWVENLAGKISRVNGPLMGKKYACMASSSRTTPMISGKAEPLFSSMNFRKKRSNNQRLRSCGEVPWRCKHMQYYGGLYFLCGHCGYSN